MDAVRQVMGKWYAYGRERVYGPFNFEKQAWAKLREEEPNGGW